jgi:predicted PurR-regulated permease PerM
VGAGAVCTCVVVGLALSDRYWAAAGLAAYSVVLVGTADNLIKAHMLHGTAKLHPLVALISVLGALKLIGLWGVFVGPMVAAFFYALLNILRNRLLESSGPDSAEG